MKQYLELIKHVLENGEWTENRTGVKTLMVPGAMMTYNLADGFPAVTTKKLAFKAVVGELCAFLRASRSAANFRALGCKVWDQNANENAAWLANPFRAGTDDLGPVYGVQWREWPGFKILDIPPCFFTQGTGVSPEDRPALDAYTALHERLTSEGWSVLGYAEESRPTQEIFYKEVDQLGDCVRTIVNNPDSRRILFHGWNPAVLDEVALPACHLLYQFMPNRNTNKLHMNVYVRSNDLGLGAPFNIAEAAVLQSLVARLTGYTPALLNLMIGDAHIYENHMDMIDEQLHREPYPLPALKINDRVPFNVDAETAVEWLKLVEPSDFSLENYLHHEPITAPMAV